MAYKGSAPITNGGSTQRTRCYLKNYKMKITMVRTCGKNARRKNCETVLKNMPEGKRSVGKPRMR
jgi:hypothetical protein